MCLGEINRHTWRYSEPLKTGRFPRTTRHSLLFLFLLLLAFLLLFTLTPDLRAAEVTLAWDPNPEPTVQGYRVYYGKSSGFYTGVVDVGNRTECVITGLDPGTTYFFACTAYNSSGDESNFSGEIVYSTQAGSSGSSSGSNSVVTKCFIATAAWGSDFAPEVVALREFRDRCLLTNRPGRAFVEWYYRVSPAVAAVIAERESLRSAVRWGLTPVVLGVKHPAVALIVLLAVPAVVVAWKRRQACKRRVTGKG
jgi:hypothetical protein